MSISQGMTADVISAEQIASGCTSQAIRHVIIVITRFCVQITCY